MKTIILAFFVVGAFSAELPRFRPARFRFQRQELAPTTTDSPTEATTEPSGPYPASGWKPAGEPFTLPNETPENTYGAPEQPTDTYGAPAKESGPYPPSGWKPSESFELPQQPPSTSYGVPTNTYGAPEASTTEVPTTDNPQAESLEGPVDVQKSEGTYYVLLPNGMLQKVLFVTENNVQNMKYTARQSRQRSPLILYRP